MPDAIPWNEFLKRAPHAGELRDAGAVFCNETVLVTGAGGYIGRAVAARVLDAGARRVILLDHSEQSLDDAVREFAGRFEGESFASVLGGAGDDLLLDELFATHQPTVVFHAAAFKHLPLMESNPIAAVENNTLATHALAQAALRHRARKVILISTDKAADPTSVMGASKRAAELVMLAMSSARTQMTAVRLGNVLGSPGSAVPLFLEQIARGGPVTITDRAATRYFITLDECARYILCAAMHESGAAILVPEMGEPYSIVALAEFLMRQAERECWMEFMGLRPGEKLHERLISETETAEDCADCGLRRVEGSKISSEFVEGALKRLKQNIAERDVAALLQTLGEMVPEYDPSDFILNLAARSGQVTSES